MHLFINNTFELIDRMGRGLSDLQKWVLSKIKKEEFLDLDIALIEFYGFEKRIFYNTVMSLPVKHHDWFKDGKKVKSSYKRIRFNYEIEHAKNKFYFSVRNLKKRGLIGGSIRTGLFLTARVH
jgi:hypothetical protein